MQQPEGIQQGSSATVGRGQQAGGLDKGVRILARTLFRYLAGQGYQARHIILLTAELIGLVTHAAREVKGVPPFSPSGGAAGVEGPR